MNRYGFKIFWSEEDHAFIATCQEFPGLSAFGSIEEEALREGKVALQMMIEAYQERGIPLPQPTQVREEGYSGQFRVRLPKSLHRQAAQIAATDGISLNQLVVSAVEQRVGAKQVGTRMLAEMKQLLTEHATQYQLTLASALTSNQRMTFTQAVRSEATNAGTSGGEKLLYHESRKGNLNG